MIEYRKAIGITTEDIELLRKLEQNFFPLQSLIYNIEHKFYSLLRVYYDSKLYGILVVRGEFKHTGELVLVIDHAIAEDHIEDHFSSILKESLWEFVANEKFIDKDNKTYYFKFIRHHAHNKGLKRMLEKHYGEPNQFIFEKDIREFKNAGNVQLQKASA